MFLMRTRLIEPICAPAGPRSRAPSRRNKGEVRTSRMVMPTTLISSSTPPSTLSSARPRELSNTQFAIAMFLNPPFDTVPNLMRPVGFLPPLSGASAEALGRPSNSAPT